MKATVRAISRSEARVEGRFVDFVVNTGASLVVLRESSPALADIRLQPRDETATAVTANGRIKAAPARIDRIEVGGITVNDVPALVLPDEVLSKNLLGVSFLSRLRRYEYANGPAARTVIGTLEIGSGALSAPAALGYWICAL